MPQTRPWNIPKANPDTERLQLNVILREIDDAVTGGGLGTVTSVGLSLPGIFTVSGSPVTTTGTLTGTLNNQTANLIFAGPSSGGAAAPTFRALTATDVPDLSGVYQPLDTDLTQIAAKTGLGILARNSGAWNLISLHGTANRIFVLDGDAVSGPPTIDISSSYVGQTSITTLGTITTGTWTGSVIGQVYGGFGSDVHDIDASKVFIGPVGAPGSHGTPTWRRLSDVDIPNLSGYYQPLDADLTLIAAKTGLGILARNSGAWNLISIGGTANRIFVLDGDAVSGPPTIDISSSYVGQTSITTLGTITTGVWNAGSVTSSSTVVASTGLTVGLGTGLMITVIDGANSGTATGSAIYLRNAGVTNNAIGGRSAIFGGAYDNRLSIYGAGGILLEQATIAQSTLQVVGAMSAASIVSGDINTLRSGSPTTGAIFFGNTGSKYIYWDGTKFDLQSAGGGLFIDSIEVGYRDLPRVTGGAERGKVYAISAGVTVNTSATSHTLMLYNDSGSAVTLTQGGGLTLRLSGTATTGSRTLAARGFCTLWFNSATECLAMGDVT